MHIITTFQTKTGLKLWFSSRNTEPTSKTIRIWFIHWIIVTMYHTIDKVFHKDALFFKTYPCVPIIIRKAIDEFRDFKRNGKQMRIHL